MVELKSPLSSVEEQQVVCNCLSRSSVRFWQGAPDFVELQKQKIGVV